MDPLDRAQVLLLCDVCQRAALQSHCELCQINLCKTCVGEHLSDSSIRHNVVPYKHRTSNPYVNYPKCPKHTQKHCELYCEKCDIPVCSTCISSDRHNGHKLTDILQNHSFIKETVNKDLKELEQRIFSTYEGIASDLNSEKLNLEKHYEKLTTAVTKQGEDWHREINIIVNKQKSEIYEMKSKCLAALNKHENEIQQIASGIKQSILDTKKILAIDSNDISLTSAYIARNAEFRSLPPKVNVSLPSFSPHQINIEQLRQMFGSLSPLFITTEEHGYTMKTPEAVSCPPVKPLLDESEIITTIDTGYKELYNVTCLSDEEIWTRGDDKIMKFHPVGITTDSQSQILTSDFNNQCIHILDQDGQFLRYIDNCDLQGPLGLCIDTNDNLFVAEFYSGKVKKIKYM